MAEVDGVGAKPATPPPPPPLQPTPPPPPPPPPGAGERDGSGAAERRPAQPPAAKDGTSPPSRGAAALASKRKKPASVRQTPEEKKRRTDRKQPPRTPSVASRQTGDEAPPDGPPTATTARQRALIAAAAATHENRRWTSWRWAVPAPQKAPARRKRPQTPPDRAPALPPAADATDGLRDRRDPKQPPKQRKQRPPRTGSPEAASARVEDGRRAPSRDELFLARQLLPPVLGTQDLEGFAQYLKTCKNVVVCVGAGASVAAGIPDFRTPGKGLYSNERLREYNVPKPEDVFNLRYFRRRPDACYSMLEDMWPGRWPPTRVHYFLKLLELKGCLSRVYTQNIDDLERLAGVPKELLVEAHGTFSYVQCVDCGFSPSVAFMRAALARGDRPLCPECLRKGLATATGIPLGDAHLPPPEAKPGDSPDLKDKGSGNPTDPQTPPAAAAAADACKPGAALKEPGSPPLPASPAAVGEGRSPAASAAAAAAAAGVNPFAPAEAAAKQARRFLFVYGSLRPDDSAGLEPTHPLFKSADFMPSTLKGVRLYHDKRPAIRLPDPGASPNDEVVGYLVRFKDDATYDEKIQELDKREGCPVLSRRGLVWVHPRDGGDRVAAEVYYSEHVACHTVVPFGDWERRREWRALPELRGLIKPGIVFFDEELPEEFAPQQIESDLGNADALIVVGTSLRVTPFCWLPQIVSSTCPRLLLNLNATEVGQKAGFTLGWQSWRDVAYDGDCQAAVTQLAAFLGWEQELLELKAKGDERMRALWKEQELTTLTIGRPTSPSLDSIDGADVDSILSVSDERSSASDDEEEANRLQAT